MRETRRDGFESHKGVYIRKGINALDEKIVADVAS